MMFWIKILLWNCKHLGPSSSYGVDQVIRIQNESTGVVKYAKEWFWYEQATEILQSMCVQLDSWKKVNGTIRIRSIWWFLGICPPLQHLHTNSFSLNQVKRIPDVAWEAHLQNASNCMFFNPVTFFSNIETFETLFVSFFFYWVS